MLRVPCFPPASSSSPPSLSVFLVLLLVFSFHAVIASSAVLESWNGRCTVPYDVVISPSSIEEIVEVVKNVEGYPSPVRPIGAMHSVGCEGVFYGENDAPSTVLTMTEKFNTIHGFQNIKSTDLDHVVLVDAGVRIVDLHEWLWEHGRYA